MKYKIFVFGDLKTLVKQNEVTDYSYVCRF